MANTVLATPKKFSMQQVFEILLRKPSDKSILAYLEDVKTSGLENTATMVYPTGGRGNVYIGGGFAHSKKATLNVTMATWNTQVMAIQNGTEVYTGAIEVTEHDIIEPTSTGAYITEHKAIGATGSEIGFVYQVNDDGTYGKQFTQGTTAAAGVFTYTPSTRTITFATADAVTGNIACAYTRTTEEGAQQIAVNADAIPDTVLATAYGLAKDICTGELYPAQIEGMAQIDGNWNIDISADGEPAVQSLNMEFVKNCSSKKLYDFRVYTSGVVA